jgi:hypothetical protein
VKTTRHLPLSAAWKSYQSAWNAVKPHWGGLLILYLVLFFVTSSTSMIPYFGLALTAFMYVILLSGLMFACHEVFHNQSISLDTLFLALFSGSIFKRIFPFALIAAVIAAMEVYVSDWFFLKTVALFASWTVIMIAISAVLFDKLSSLKALGLAIRAFGKNVLVIVLWLCIPAAASLLITAFFLSLVYTTRGLLNFWPIEFGTSSDILKIAAIAVSSLAAWLGLHLGLIVVTCSGYVLTRAMIPGQDLDRLNEQPETQA